MSSTRPARCAYNDAIERFVVRIRGRFVEGGVSGTFSERAVARARRGGQVVGRCATGRLAFNAFL